MSFGPGSRLVVWRQYLCRLEAALRLVARVDQLTAAGQRHDTDA